MDLLLLSSLHKVSPCSRPYGPRGGVEVLLYSFMTSALDGGGWSISHHDLHCITSGKVLPMHAVKAYREVKLQLHAFLTLYYQVLEVTNSFRDPAPDLFLEFSFHHIVWYNFWGKHRL